MVSSSYIESEYLYNLIFNIPAAFSIPTAFIRNVSVFSMSFFTNDLSTYLLVDQSTQFHIYIYICIPIFSRYSIQTRVRKKYIIPSRNYLRRSSFYFHYRFNKMPRQQRRSCMNLRNNIIHYIIILWTGERAYYTYSIISFLRASQSKRPTHAGGCV